MPPVFPKVSNRWLEFFSDCGGQTVFGNVDIIEEIFVADADVYARAHDAGCFMYAGHRLHRKALMLLFAIEYQAVPHWNFLRCNNSNRL